MIPLVHRLYCGCSSSTLGFEPVRCDGRDHPPKCDWSQRPERVWSVRPALGHHVGPDFRFLSGQPFDDVTLTNDPHSLDGSRIDNPTTTRDDLLVFNGCLQLLSVLRRDDDLLPVAE
jgi:hypothetical protein